MKKSTLSIFARVIWVLGSDLAGMPAKSSSDIMDGVIWDCVTLWLLLLPQWILLGSVRSRHFAHDIHKNEYYML